MAAEDRSRLLLYFAAYVPGGLEAADAEFLLRLPIFPGVAHSTEGPAWRPLTTGNMTGGEGAAAAMDAAVCPAAVLDAVCGGWADLPPASQVRFRASCRMQECLAREPLGEHHALP